MWLTVSGTSSPFFGGLHINCSYFCRHFLPIFPSEVPIKLITLPSLICLGSFLWFVVGALPWVSGHQFMMCIPFLTKEFSQC